MQFIPKDTRADINKDIEYRMDEESNAHICTENFTLILSNSEADNFAMLIARNSQRTELLQTIMDTHTLREVSRLGRPSTYSGRLMNFFKPGR